MKSTLGFVITENDLRSINCDSGRYKFGAIYAAAMIIGAYNSR